MGQFIVIILNRGKIEHRWSVGVCGIVFGGQLLLFHFDVVKMVELKTKVLDRICLYGNLKTSNSL